MAIFLIPYQTFADVVENTKELRSEYKIDIDEVIVDCLIYFVNNIGKNVTDDMIISEIISLDRIEEFKWRKLDNVKCMNKYRIFDVKLLYKNVFYVLAITIQGHLRSIGLTPLNLKYRYHYYIRSHGIALEICERGSYHDEKVLIPRI